MVSECLWVASGGQVGLVGVLLAAWPVATFASLLFVSQQAWPRQLACERNALELLAL